MPVVCESSASNSGSLGLNGVIEVYVCGNSIPDRLSCQHHMVPSTKEHNPRTRTKKLGNISRNITCTSFVVQVGMSLMFPINPADPMPLYAQLTRAIRFAVTTGRLRIGEQLPTVRQLAVDLRINAN